MLDISAALSSIPLSVLLSGLIAMGVLSWLRPKGRIAFHHAKDNNLTLTKSGGKEHTTFLDVCRSATPESCNLNPLLFNGHLQTAWTTMKHDNVPVYYKRSMFESDSSAFTGHYAIDFVVAPYDVPNDPELTDEARKHTQKSGMPPRTCFFSKEEFDALPSDDTKPMLVVLHGLSGGSHEVYLRHILAPLVADGTWEACVVNSRGCSQTKISTGVLYNARATWDVRQAVKWIRAKFPNRPLFGIGFSLGANILTNVCILQHLPSANSTDHFAVLGRGR
jgi:predicted alpha/beta-fold hydrolase